MAGFLPSVTVMSPDPIAINFCSSFVDSLDGGHFRTTLTGESPQGVIFDPKHTDTQRQSPSPEENGFP